MAAETLNKEKARFDTRLSKEQKALFEHATRLGGYRNLTDFVVQTVQKKATEIIEENEQIIASQRDAEIFFKAITKASKPNKKLVEAAKEYKAKVAK